jgi:hypothetical protein
MKGAKVVISIIPTMKAEVATPIVKSEEVTITTPTMKVEVA